MHRLIAAIFVLALMAPATSSAQPAGSMPSLEQLREIAAGMTPSTRAVVTPLLDAVPKLRAELARLPPPQDDAEKLRRLGRLDQAPRAALSEISLAQLPADQRKAASAAIGVALLEVDEANLVELLALVPAGGWFSRAVYGPEASTAAFHIVQHSNLATWRRFAPALERFAAAGDMDRAEYAKFSDRLALAEGRPQRHATQMRCEAGAWRLLPTEAPPIVNDARASAGQPPLAEHLAKLAEESC